MRTDRAAATDQTAQPERTRIRPARGMADVAAVRTLMREYADWLSVDLGAAFETELAGLPGPFGPPGGELLLAEDGDGAPLGCVGLRALPDTPGRCEIKRLYVRPAGRGGGAGRALLRVAMAEARGLGHAEMVLDSLPKLEAAIALYRSLGFVEIAPYWRNPLPGTRYLGRRLGQD